MHAGDALMRLTIAGSIVCYAAAEYLWFTRRRAAFRGRAWLWTAAAALCIVHSALAFAVHHRWSHDAALRQTAAQTAAVTGIAWGGGLYVNYAFLLGWAVDVLLLWRAPQRYLARSAVTNAVVSAIFLFMFVNGAVVFASGPARVLGVAATATVMLGWWGGARRPSG